MLGVPGRVNHTAQPPEGRLVRIDKEVRNAVDRLELPFNSMGVDPYGISKCAPAPRDDGPGGGLPLVLLGRDARHRAHPAAGAGDARGQPLRRHRHRRRDGHRVVPARDEPAPARAGHGGEVSQPPALHEPLDGAHRAVHGAARARRATARGRPPAHGVPRGGARHGEALQGAQLARGLRQRVRAPRPQDEDAHRAVRGARRRRGLPHGRQRLQARAAARGPVRPHRRLRAALPHPRQDRDRVRRRRSSSRAPATRTTRSSSATSTR